MRWMLRVALPKYSNSGKPILGLCYGLQLIAHEMGGVVDKSARREYGRAEIIIEDKNAKLLQRFSRSCKCLDCRMGTR